MASAEDAAAQVVKPRLMAAGADCDEVRLVKVDVDQVAGGLSLPEDVGALKEILRAEETDFS
jgi:hypothetical protein